MTTASVLSTPTSVTAEVLPALLQKKTKNPLHIIVSAERFRSSRRYMYMETKRRNCRRRHFRSASENGHENSMPKVPCRLCRGFGAEHRRGVSLHTLRHGFSSHSAQMSAVRQDVGRNCGWLPEADLSALRSALRGQVPARKRRNTVRLLFSRVRHTGVSIGQAEAARRRRWTPVRMTFSVSGRFRGTPSP